ncbi:hypothetical protein BD413DRAFT_537098 [Trametes elegans]|nr:hypothetical protein BD413DRAFT_537098 [Trametes elegans]
MSTPDACHASTPASVLPKSTPPSSPRSVKVGSVENVRHLNTPVSPSPAVSLSDGSSEPRVDPLAFIGVRSKWDRQRDLLELLADGLVVSDSDSRCGSGSSGLGSGALGDASVAAVVGSQTGSGSGSGGIVALGSGCSGARAGPGAVVNEAYKRASLAPPAHRVKLPDATTDASLVRGASQDGAMAQALELNTVSIDDSLVPTTLSQLQPTTPVTTPELRVVVVVKLAGNAPEPSFASVGRTALRLLGSPAIPADPCRLAPSDALVERIHFKAGPPLLLPQERDWPLVPRLRQSSAPASHAGSRDSLRQNIKLALARYHDQLHLSKTQTRARRRIRSSSNIADALVTVTVAAEHHYDPWALEDAQRTAADAGMGRARHQGGPSRLSKGRRGAAAVGRQVRMQTALLGLAGVGEEGVRRRRTTTQITGGRYAVLECDVLLV